MTLQKRHRETELSLIRAHEQRDAAIARLVRAEGRLRDLLKAKARQEKALAKRISPVPVSVAEGKVLPEPQPAPAAALNDDVTDIPFSELPIADVLDEEVVKFEVKQANARINGDDNPIPEMFRRVKEVDARDAEIAAQMKADQAERKRRKALARIAKMKAKDAGELKKMPLTGREAFRFAMGQAKKLGAKHQR